MLLLSFHYCKKKTKQKQKMMTCTPAGQKKCVSFVSRSAVGVDESGQVFFSVRFV